MKFEVILREYYSCSVSASLQLCPSSVGSYSDISVMTELSSGTRWSENLFKESGQQRVKEIKTLGMDKKRLSNWSSFFLVWASCASCWGCRAKLCHMWQSDKEPLLYLNLIHFADSDTHLITCPVFSVAQRFHTHRVCFLNSACLSNINPLWEHYHFSLVT